jgi:hypothetical protein
VNPSALRTALDARLDDRGQAWLTDAQRILGRDPAAIRTLFPQVGRRLGRGPLDDAPGWTADEAGRAVLLDALGDRVGAELGDLYRHGDAAERRGVLRALDVLVLDDEARAVARDLVADALRTNDTRLVAAALGPFGVRTLDDDALAHAVLKCVFTGVPLAGVAGLDRRATPDLSRMLAGYAHERIAAGRTVPPEVWPLIDAHPPGEELAAITAELDSPVPDRREAARAALSHPRPPAAPSPAARKDP